MISSEVWNCCFGIMKKVKASGKRLISFDGATVGFRRIVKMAKRGSIKDCNKK